MTKIHIYELNLLYEVIHNFTVILVRPLHIASRFVYPGISEWHLMNPLTRSVKFNPQGLPQPTRTRLWKTRPQHRHQIIPISLPPASSSTTHLIKQASTSIIYLHFMNHPRFISLLDFRILYSIPYDQDPGERTRSSCPAFVCKIANTNW
jgi:hypothetical protein